MTEDQNGRRQSQGAAALICRHRNGRCEWLTRWNEKWASYYFVGGHKHEDETFAQCLVREIKEELGIDLGKDFVMADRPVAHLEYTAPSRSASVATDYTIEMFGVQSLTDYVVHMFGVRLQDADATADFQAPHELQWVTEEEIRSRRCRDGRPVSETMERLLNAISWTCPIDSCSRADP